MNIDEKAEIPATAAQIWPDTTLISRKTIPERTLRRRRAEADGPLVASPRLGAWSGDVATASVVARLA